MTARLPLREPTENTAVVAELAQFIGTGQSARGLAHELSIRGDVVDMRHMLQGARSLDCSVREYLGEPFRQVPSWLARRTAANR